MQNQLNHYPIYFPNRNEQLYTLKEFLDSSINDKYHLPMIVNITSLNNYGRAIKNLFTKNTQLLLINIYQLDSIIAEYHRSNDSRQHSHRNRLIIKQGKMATKASTKFRNMKKLSKSLASLTTVNQPNNNLNDDDSLDGEDDQTYHQRHLVKNLNEKRSSATPLCRLPMQYRRYFELLDENDKAIDPYHKLTDLIRIEYDEYEPEKRIEKWPHAFFLRSSCSAYTKKETSDILPPPIINDQNSNSTASSDSCYSSSSDLDSSKNFILLNEEIQTLQAGQILMILGDCLAVHERISQKEVKEQPQPPSPSSSYLSTASWFKDKSKLLFSKKRRQSNNTENISNALMHSKIIPKKCESYLKCQTQQGDTVYISLDESGLFSPLNLPTHRLKFNTESTRIDISGIFQLKHLLSNFRFPLSVRHLEGSISFDNLYLPASINRQESPTKLRLLMLYNEQVVFACPLNLPSLKSSKTSSSSSCMVIPLSIDADIEIQPCINMYDISRTEEFHKLMDRCFQLIEHYQNEISLMNFPLQWTGNITRPKQALYKKRSQSESFVEFFDQAFKHNFRHSDEQLNYENSYTDNSSSSVPSPLRYRDSIETIKQKLSTDTERATIHRSGHYTKIKTDKQKRYSRDEYTSEDEIYQDVDKIYDYIRSGDITDDVQKIQAKERVYNDAFMINSPSLNNKRSEQLIPAIYSSPGKMITHRFIPEIGNVRSPDDDLDFHSCKNDGNVDDDQAHALFLASKQRTKANSQDYSESKSTTKMKKINKH